MLLTLPNLHARGVRWQVAPGMLGTPEGEAGGQQTSTGITFGEGHAETLAGKGIAMGFVGVSGGIGGYRVVSGSIPQICGCTHASVEISKRPAAPGGIESSGCGPDAAGRSGKGYRGGSAKCFIILGGVQAGSRGSGAVERAKAQSRILRMGRVLNIHKAAGEPRAISSS